MRRKPVVFFAVALAVGIACSKLNTTNNNATTADGGGSSGDDGASSGGGDGAVENPADTTPRVRYVGRVDTSDPAGPRIAWGGTRIIMRFRGPSVRVKIAEQNVDQGPSGYDVFVDGALRAKPFVPNEGTSDYDLATGLAADQPHVVELYRRTEAMVAISQILKIEFPDGELLAPPAFPNRRIEILGDSESTGYGVECPDSSGDFTGATENDRKAYPALVAKAVGAEVHNISYSGKGIIRNQDADPTLAADFYVQSIPAYGAKAWSFTAWTPDIVWIALGGNDWDLGASGDRPPPDIGELTTKYKALVDLVRAKNPNAQIVCAVQGMLTDAHPPGYSSFSNHKTILKAIVDERHAAGDAKVHYHEHPRASEVDLSGCDSHPNVAFHVKTAASVGPKISAIMGWK